MAAVESNDTDIAGLNIAVEGNASLTTTYSYIHELRTEQFYSSVMAIVGLASALLIVLITAYRYFLRRDTPTVYSTRALAAMVSARERQIVNLRRLRLLEQLFLHTDDDFTDENSELCHTYRVRFERCSVSERCPTELPPWHVNHCPPIRTSDPPDYNDLIGCGVIDAPPPDYEAVINYSAGVKGIHSDSFVVPLSVSCDFATVSEISDACMQPVTVGQTIPSGQTIVESSVTEQLQACRDLIHEAMLSVDRINLEVLPSIVESYNSEASCRDSQSELR